MTIYRPTSDVSAPGWSSTAGTLAAAINETAADDASYITSPDVASPTPYRFNIGPLPSGEQTLRIRARRVGTAGEARLVLLDAGAAEVGASDWQALTDTWTTYPLTAVASAVATMGEIQVRSGVVAWTPAVLFGSGEQGAWYDPSDLSTLFQDSAGTIPVTAAGQSVGRMLDKSGRGNHATQATTSLKPILQQDANGKYYLAFDGVDDSMATAAVNFTATDKMTVFAGARINSTSPGFLLETSATANANAGAFNVYFNDVGTYGIVARANKQGSPTGPAEVSIGSANTSVWSIDYDFNRTNGGQAVYERRNGAAYANGGSFPAGAEKFGNYALYIGARAGTQFHMNGRIYQLIIRGAQTDAAGISAAESFVNTKTGAY